MTLLGLVVSRCDPYTTIVSLYRPDDTGEPRTRARRVIQRMTTATWVWFFIFIFDDTPRPTYSTKTRAELDSPTVLPGLGTPSLFRLLCSLTLAPKRDSAEWQAERGPVTTVFVQLQIFYEYHLHIAMCLRVLCDALVFHFRLSSVSRALLQARGLGYG